MSTFSSQHSVQAKRAFPPGTDARTRRRERIGAARSGLWQQLHGRCSRNYRRGWDAGRELALRGLQTQEFRASDTAC